MNYIPTIESGFHDWVNKFAKYIKDNYRALGLTEEQNEALQSLFIEWKTIYDEHISIKKKAKSIAKQKNEAHESLEKKVRELTNIIQIISSLTDEQKTALGITIRKTTKTLSPVPSTRPIANIENSEHLIHKIHFLDESTPESKKKPYRVQGCEIWHKIDGTKPKDETEIKYITTSTKTPCIVDYKDTDAGKMAHYMLRWINTRGERGPWSETISITISG